MSPRPSPARPRCCVTAAPSVGDWLDVSELVKVRHWWSLTWKGEAWWGCGGCLKTVVVRHRVVPKGSTRNRWEVAETRDLVQKGGVYLPSGEVSEQLPDVCWKGCPGILPAEQRIPILRRHHSRPPV